MNILFTIVQSLHQIVKQKFFDDANMISQTTLNINQDKPFWNCIDRENGASIFESLIAKGRDLRPVYLYKLAKYAHTEGKIRKHDTLEYVSFRDDYLVAFLEYLEYHEESLHDTFIQFCSESEILPENIQNQKLLPKERERSERENTINKDDVKRIGELRKELGRIMYSSTKIKNSKWWFYFHAYTKYKILPERENTWTLVKLLLIFEDIDENGDLIVKIDNTGIEHYDYIGTVDFPSSRAEILVMNLKTVPYLGRQLNIKVHVGTGEGDIFLGQYLNYESDSHIISGNVILERINERKKRGIILEPAVYQIQNLSSANERYKMDHESISRYILQYLHDKNKNFRRTPLRVGHSLHGLKSWLRTRRVEDGLPLP